MNSRGDNMSQQSEKGDLEIKEELMDMAVMNKPVNLAFIVREDKAEEFINSKTSKETMDKIRKQASEMMKHSTFNGKPWEERFGEKFRP